MAEYRRDGWPLCPRCGEDELASQVRHQPGGFKWAPITPADPMACLFCCWEGRVPLRVVEPLRSPAPHAQGDGDPGDRPVDRSVDRSVETRVDRFRRRLAESAVPTQGG